MNVQQAGTPVAFLYVGDRERALAFYRETLGLALRGSDPFGDFIDLGGALLRMTVMPDHKPLPHPVLGWDVEDIGAAVEALRGRGIAFTVYEGMGQDALGIWTAPDGQSKVAFFADPEGNVLTLSQA
jgi:catechol 2,3-dioxygenase-like lactoylglutathione lyase family enzyme